jgi:hypothetical protein
MSKEDDFYAKVADEISAGQLDRTLWTKAFAQADGEENRAKATYIRLRTAQLQEQEANRPDKFLPEGLAFTDSSLSYQGKTIPYSQVSGVTFYSVEKSVNGIPKEDSHTIIFRSSRETIELKRTTYFKIRLGSEARTARSRTGSILVLRRTHDKAVGFSDYNERLVREPERQDLGLE